MRYFIELSYKGTNYNGWQIQDNAPSVQQTLSEGISTILRTPIEIVGAGRTDTGVHAAFYVAHFDFGDEIGDSKEFCYHLNSLLPNDISASKIYLVNDETHARFDAIEREYRYYICSEKNPFSRETTWQLYADLDMDTMNKAASYLLEYDDFTSFAKLNSNNKTNICHVTKAEWVKIECGMSVFTIRSNRFLRNMVRSIVGTLVDVGRGKLTLEQFLHILTSKDLSLSGSSAPAQGLFLHDVTYPKKQ